METPLSSFYRFPEDSLQISLPPELVGSSGVSRLGNDEPSSFAVVNERLHLVPGDGRFGNMDAMVEDLRRERYFSTAPAGDRKLFNALVRAPYYLVRELLPTSVRRHFQRFYFKDWQTLEFPRWPVDFTVETLQEEFLGLQMKAAGVQKMPFIWFWPEGAPSCLIMTHDVETAAGRDAVSALMDLDESYGIKASFQSIPEKRYTIPDEYVLEMRSRGFEFNIHDLNHDGHLFHEREEFLRRAAKINGYVHKYQARGFRAGAMYRNQDWFDVFEFSYDMSVPNVAHLEPQRGGCCTVMPYFIGKIVELPLTCAQDYTVLHILQQESIDLWRQQLALLRERHGLMSFIAHPDYLIARRPRSLYESLLGYLQEMIARENIWMALPGEVDRWWRARSQMKLVPGAAGGWSIEGPQKERAVVAYAVVDDAGTLRYEVPGGANGKLTAEVPSKQDS